MQARKRMIDSEFWRDGRLVRMAPDVRFLFIALICHADDRGVLPASSDDLEVAIGAIGQEWVREGIQVLLKAERIIEFGDEDDAPHWWIPHFAEYQALREITPRYACPPKEVIVAALGAVTGRQTIDKWTTKMRGAHRSGTRLPDARQERVARDDRATDARQESVARDDRATDARQESVARDDRATDARRSRDGCATIARRNPRLEHEHEPEHEHHPPLPPTRGDETDTPPPRISSVPRTILRRAEEVTGRPLSSGEQRILIRWHAADQHSESDILDALDVAAENDAKKPIPYAGRILADGARAAPVAGSNGAKKAEADDWWAGVPRL